MSVCPFVCVCLFKFQVEILPFWYILQQHPECIQNVSPSHLHLKGGNSVLIKLPPIHQEYSQGDTQDPSQ